MAGLLCKHLIFAANGGEGAFNMVSFYAALNLSYKASVLNYHYISSIPKFYQILIALMQLWASVWISGIYLEFLDIFVVF